MSDEKGLLELNVGGTVFTTTYATVRQFESSTLWRMVRADSHLGTQRDKEGRIFIDRDAAAFAHVIHFLRTIAIPPHVLDDRAACLALQNEADYFGILSLVDALDRRLSGAEGLLELNVGGTIFTTTYATVYQFSPSALSEIVVEEIKGTVGRQRDGKGRIFIDRDPAPFAHLLHFLRTSTIPPSAFRDRTARMALREEASHFEISPLVHELDRLPRGAGKKLRKKSCAIVCRIVIGGDEKPGKVYINGHPLKYYSRTYGPTPDPCQYLEHAFSKTIRQASGDAFFDSALRTIIKVVTKAGFESSSRCARSMGTLVTR